MVHATLLCTEGFSVNVYGNIFENGDKFQTYAVGVKETTKQFIQKVLRRNHLNLKDPNLFYMTFQIDPFNMLTNYEHMNTFNYSAFHSNGTNEKNPTGILYSNAILSRTLDLRKDNRLTIHTHPGQLIRIYDTCFSKPPSIRQLYVSRTTCCEEVIQLVLNLVGSNDEPAAYCLVEENISDKGRILRDKDYPLLIARMNGLSAVLILQKRENALRSEKSRKKTWLIRSKTYPCRPSSPEVTYQFESTDNINTCGRFNPLPFLLKGMSRGKATESHKSSFPVENNFVGAIRSHSCSSTANQKHYFDMMPQHNPPPEKSESAKEINRNDPQCKAHCRFTEFNASALLSTEKCKSAPTEMYQSGSNWSLAPSGFNNTSDNKSFNNFLSHVTPHSVNAPGKNTDLQGVKGRTAQIRDYPLVSPSYPPWRPNTGSEMQKISDVFSNYECEHKASKSHPDISKHDRFQLGGNSVTGTGFHTDLKSSKSLEKVPVVTQLQPVMTELEQIWSKKRITYQLKPESFRKWPTPHVPPVQHGYLSPQKHVDTKMRNAALAATINKRSSPITLIDVENKQNHVKSCDLDVPNERVLTDVGRVDEVPLFKDRSLPESTCEHPIVKHNNQAEPKSFSTKSTYIPGRFLGVQNVIQNSPPKRLFIKDAGQLARKVEPVKSEETKSNSRYPNGTKIGLAKQSEQNDYVQQEQRPKSKWSTVLKELTADMTNLENQYSKMTNIDTRKTGAASPGKKPTSTADISKPTEQISDLMCRTTVTVPFMDDPVVTSTRSFFESLNSNQAVQMNQKPQNIKTSTTLHLPMQKSVLNKAEKSQPTDNTTLTLPTKSSEKKLLQNPDDMFNFIRASAYPSLFDILHHCNIIRITLDPNIPGLDNQLGLTLGLSKFPLDDIQRANNLQRLKETEFKGFTSNWRLGMNNDFQSKPTGPRPNIFPRTGGPFRPVDFRQKAEAPEVVTVEAIVPNSPASIEGSLSTGMLILEINGEPLIQTLGINSRSLLKEAQQQLRSSYYAAKKSQAPLVKITAAKYHNRFGVHNKAAKWKESESEDPHTEHTQPQTDESKLPNSVWTTKAYSPLYSPDKISQRPTCSSHRKLDQEINRTEMDSRSEITNDAGTRNSDASSLKDRLQWFPAWSLSNRASK